MNGNEFIPLKESDAKEHASMTILESESKIERYYGFQSDVTTVLNMYRELRDITAQQNAAIQRAETNILTNTEYIKQAETDLAKADDEDSTNKKRKIAITASIVSGALLASVVGGAPVAIPIGLVGGITSWMMWRK